MDGKKDCDDGSDEKIHEKVHEKGRSQFGICRIPIYLLKQSYHRTANLEKDFI